MYQTINNIVRNAIRTSSSDPTRIPAKLSLEGIGTIPYTVYEADLFGGAQHRVVADDPNRTWHYVRAPNNWPQARPEFDLVPEAPAPRNTNNVATITLFGSLAGIFVGLGLGIAAAATLNPWVGLASIIVMAVSSIALALAVSTLNIPRELEPA